MTSAFQANAFQNDAFQVSVANTYGVTLDSIDSDKSGNPVPRFDTFLGPSLGRVIEPVKPMVYLTNPGAYVVTSACVLLVMAGGAVTINLPDVRTWMKQPGYQPATAFERAIWVKDFGGNASNWNISITPFGSQTIDGLSQFTIISNHLLVRLHPLNDLSGWYTA